MSPVIEQKVDTIARDLVLMDELEAFAQTLPPRTEGRDPTPQEIRTMAYEEREAKTLLKREENP